MALTERLALLVTAQADEALLTFDRLGHKMATIDAQAKRTSLGTSAVLTGGAVLVGAALGKMVLDGAKALAVQQQIDAQTQAVLNSTGSVAGVTAKQVGQLAQQVSHYSTFSIDAVKASENMLLSFTAVRNSAGAGNDIFDRTIKTAADLSARFGIDLTSATQKLGRALQDPVAGMNALTRSGVAFDAQTKAQIKSLAKQGDLLDAQKLLLDAVNAKVGGAADAAGKTAAGGFAQFRNALEELDKTLAKPLLAPLTQGLHDVASGFRIINEHPLAEKVVEGIVAVGTTAIIASKAIGLLKSARDSELVKLLASTAARERSIVALDAEAAAAGRAAGAVGALDAAEGAGGIAGGAGLLTRLKGLLGPIGLGVTAGEVGSHLLFGKGLENIPGMLHAKGIDNQLNALLKQYPTDTYGQKKAFDALRPEVISATAAAFKGDYSHLSGALNDLNKALAANVGITSAAAAAENQHTTSLKLNLSVAQTNLAQWLASSAERQKAVAAEASKFDPFGELPGSKLLSKAASTSVASDSANLAARSARDTVARDEDRLAKLRESGKATADQLAAAELNLARAKERAALAGDRATTAQAKANQAAAQSGGLSVKDLLGRETGNLLYSQTLASDSAKLVKAGFSIPVLDKLRETEKQFPGTIHNLVIHLTSSLVHEMNADESKIEAAQIKYFGMDNAVTTRLKQLAVRQAEAILSAYQATFAGAPPIQGPRINPSIPPYPSPRPPVQGPPIRTGVAPYPSSHSTTNYYLSGNIVASSPAQLRDQLARDARLANLGLG